ncbi:hypothetical protein RHMOL_RhmolUnG0006100 [Rhododendron molle]|nr:hypothetical protein RHMOL_RhmolUnG0006100 [Rhododendron molle]
MVACWTCRLSYHFQVGAAQGQPRRWLAGHAELMERRGKIWWGLRPQTPTFCGCGSLWLLPEMEVLFGPALVPRCPRKIPPKQAPDQALPDREWQIVTNGNAVRNIGGSEALDAVTIPVVAVVDTAIPTVTEGVTHESESEGEELNVSPDIPLEVKEAAGALSSSGEVDSVRPPHEPDPVVTGVVPSQPVLIVKPVPPDDKAVTVQGNVALQSPHEVKTHCSKGSGNNSSKKWSKSSKRRNK